MLQHNNGCWVIVFKEVWSDVLMGKECIKDIRGFPQTTTFWKQDTLWSLMRACIWSVYGNKCRFWDRAVIKILWNYNMGVQLEATELFPMYIEVLF